MNPGELTTVAAVLGGGDPARAEQWLERGLARVDTAEQAISSVGTFGAATFRLLDQRIVDALRAPLAAQVGGWLLEGWRKFRELIAAAERTRDNPGPSEDVVLVDHEITSTQRHTVDVIVNGSVVKALDFEVTVTLELRGVVAVVGEGRLTAIRCGDVRAGARLSLEGQELCRGELPVAVGALVRLGDGIELVAPASAAASSPPSWGPGPETTSSPPPWMTPSPRSEPATGASTPADASGLPWWQRVSPSDSATESSEGSAGRRAGSR
jgi:hypothetical protein